LTILLPMNPAIRPRTIQAIIDMTELLFAREKPTVIGIYSAAARDPCARFLSF
jgi:hypothetical protein